MTNSVKSACSLSVSLGLNGSFQDRIRRVELVETLGYDWIRRIIRQHALVRLFRDACRDAPGELDGKINQKIAQRAINELCEMYQRAVADEDYEYLIETYKTKGAGNNEHTRRLIFNNAILVYDENGVKWQDVHPALVYGKKFKKLLQGS
ncbi:hypothetical protein HYR99_00680 [Candidatus Poribacteria bacterium]|nr:hypothetical protein [Candidatus Poribacteria bacterium]